MKTVELKMSDEVIQCNPKFNVYFELGRLVAEEGYIKCNGVVKHYREEWNRNIYYVYFPSYADILFKRFKRWVAPWEKRKEILFRKFRRFDG